MKYIIKYNHLIRVYAARCVGLPVFFITVALITSGCQIGILPQVSDSQRAVPNRPVEQSQSIGEKRVKRAVIGPVEQKSSTSRSTEGLRANDAKILMRSTGMPMNVDYSVSESEEACQEFTKVGTVRDKGEQVLLSWIVKLSEKLNSVPDQVETVVNGGQPVQVAGWGNWYDSKSKGNCGPVIVSFQPEASRTYLVEFVWQGTARCTSRVHDITDPVTRLPVVSVPQVCSRSFMDVWLGRSGL